MNKKRTSELPYDRNAELTKEFNTFWSEWQNKNGQLTRDIPLSSLKNVVLLKSALHNINNIATLKTTELLVDKLVKFFPVRFKAVEKDIRNKIRNESPNANGYDIQFESDTVSFVAEIKCNIPFQQDKQGNWKFGANQTNGIKKDIENLKFGKSKADLKKGKKYYKFLGIYDYEKRSGSAMAQILESDRVKKCTPIMHLRKDVTLMPEVIYVVMLGSD